MGLIAGMVNHSEHEHVSPISLEATPFVQALRQYPADDMRCWQDREVMLACLVHWITPESVHEQLPHAYSEQQLVITADAILDNREELLHSLQVASPDKKNITDSALILRAYLKWGQQAPKHLIGDYAFTIWDAKKRMLFGARDLAGNRTLYYYNDHRRFAFCSAIAPLLAIPGIKKELDESWLAEYLAIPVTLDSTDAYATAYRNIQQVPPGCSILLRDGKLIVNRYDMLVPNEIIEYPSDGEYVEAFRDVLGQAVKARLRTCKQVGATLSGGLDSGCVAGFASRLLSMEGKTLHTYSYVPAEDFEDWTASHLVANEKPFIQATVRHNGNIHDHYPNFLNQNPYTAIDDMLSILEFPYKYFENSYWIKGIYETASQQGMGILLTGARGNNSISWGSVTGYCIQLLKSLNWIQFYRQAALFSRQMNVGRSRVLPAMVKLAFPLWNRLPFTKSEQEFDFQPMIHPAFAARTNIYERLSGYDVGLKPSFTPIREERQKFFSDLAILNMQGTAGAKLSQRYGLWERDPTCDPRVVRFCLSIPIEQYVLGGMSRSLIRRSTKQELPNEVRLNQRYRGVQSADWVHRMIPVWPQFIEELHQLSRDPAVHAYLDTDQLKEILRDIGGTPKPEQAADAKLVYAMRSLIAGRFIRSF